MSIVSVITSPLSCCSTRYKLLFDDWRGYFIAGFSLVWLANVYMSFFGRLRLEIREDRIQIVAAEARERSDVGNAENDRGMHSGSERAK